MFEPLLLANSYTHTLRPVRSRASTIAKEPARLHAYLRLRFLVGRFLGFWVGWLSGLRGRLRGSQSDVCLLLQFLVSWLRELHGYFVEYGLTHFGGFVSQVGCLRCSSCVQIWWVVVRG